MQIFFTTVRYNKPQITACYCCDLVSSAATYYYGKNFNNLDILGWFFFVWGLIVCLGGVGAFLGWFCWFFCFVVLGFLIFFFLLTVPKTPPANVSGRSGRRHELVIAWEVRNFSD